jgi:hypothetical protein
MIEPLRPERSGADHGGAVEVEEWRGSQTPGM